MDGCQQRPRRFFTCQRSLQAMKAARGMSCMFALFSSIFETASTLITRDQWATPCRLVSCLSPLSSIAHAPSFLWTSRYLCHMNAERLPVCLLLEPSFQPPRVLSDAENVPLCPCNPLSFFSTFAFALQRHPKLVCGSCQWPRQRHSYRSPQVRSVSGFLSLALNHLSIPSLTSLLPSETAQGFAIFTVVKAGFLFSARGGSGIVIARLPDGTWSAPSAIGTAGVGFGGQAGAEITEFLLVLSESRNLPSSSLEQLPMLTHSCVASDARC